MKTFTGIFAAAVLLATGCSTVSESADARGSGFNASNVVRNESTGHIAGSPDPAPPR